MNNNGVATASLNEFTEYPDHALVRYLTLSARPVVLPELEYGGPLNDRSELVGNTGPSAILLSQTTPINLGFGGAWDINDATRTVQNDQGQPAPIAFTQAAGDLYDSQGENAALCQKNIATGNYQKFNLNACIPTMTTSGGTVVPGWYLPWTTHINDAGAILCNGWPKDSAGNYIYDSSTLHVALLLPIEIVDTKNKILDDGDDVNVDPKKTIDEKNAKSIAWIEPHGSEDTLDAPDMPQLALRFRGTETMGLKIKWKLAVKYNRPRGDQPNEARIKEEDEVYIPRIAGGQQSRREESLDGVVEMFNDADWSAEITEKGFFGGEAELKYQLVKADGTALSTETTMLFSIGGKNPGENLAKQYIDDNATSAHGTMWFAYAIAKSESSAFNPSDRYNQFWKKTGSYDKRPHKQGEPTWAKASWEESAGGFGIFQVTGDITSKFFTIPREQMWNWQKHVLAGLTIVRHKQDAAYDGTWDYMNGTMPHRKIAGQPRGQRPQAKKSNNNINVLVPTQTVRPVTFQDGTARPIESAVTIKAYNGATRHYCGWNNATKKWEFFPTNGKFNYVDRVCQEVE